MKQLISTLTICLAIAGAAFAQNDPFGVTDTVALVADACPVAGGSNQLVLELWVYNDEIISNARLGFSWDNARLHLDSAVATPFAIAGFDLARFFYENANLETSNANDRFLFDGETLFSPGVPAQTARQHWVTYYFTATDWTGSDMVTFDTLTYSAQTGHLLTVYPSGTVIVPAWDGPVSCGLPCSPPMITTCPPPADTSFCGLGTVCGPLVCESADQIISTLGGTIANDEICWEFDETTATVDTIIATNSCGADTCIVPVTISVGTAPTITTCPGQIDTTICGPATICAPLMCEDADQVVSALGATITGDEICWEINVATDAVDTIIATNFCGADTCIVPMTVSVGATPTIACPDSAIVVETDAQSPQCINLPIADAEQVSIISVPTGLNANWNADLVCFEIDGPASYDLIVAASNMCGAVACTLDVQITTPGITPTNEWISTWCESGQVDGNPLNPGDLVEVTDPDGVLCGMATVNAFGGYGYLNVYRDDPYTPQDEGAEPGDTLTFWVNGTEAIIDPPVTWTSHGDIVPVCDFITQVCQTLSLHAGWNLVSWNVGYVAPIDSVLADLGGCVDVVLGLHESGGVVYDPDLPQYSTLDTVNYHHGYWFRMSCPMTIDLCGPPIQSDDPLQLRAGWNLTSYWPDEASPVDQALASVLGCVGVVLGFDDGGQVWVPGMDLYNTFNVMAPGFGYWIKSACDTTLVYPGFGPAGLPPAGAARVDSPVLSPYWMSVYGSDLQSDGAPVRSGARVEVRTSDGVPCGWGTYDGHRLSLTPVYGRAGVEENDGLPQPGDDLSIWIDGHRSGYALTWTRHGDRVALTDVSSGGTEGLPHSFRLYQNCPNPFNPTTEIRFDLPSASHVSLDVYNLLGRRVRSLLDMYLEAGNHRVEWDGTDDGGGAVASGIYFYRVETASGAATRKMLLLK